MRKKLFVALLAFCMVLSRMPGTAWAEGPSTGSCGEYAAWSYDPGNNTLTISGKGAIGPLVDFTQKEDVIKVEFAAEDGGNFTEISGTFSGFKNLPAITLPDTITKIGSNSFSDCTGLNAIHIPASVTTMWEYFIGCTNLENITVGDGNENLYSTDGLLIAKTSWGVSLMRCPEGRKGTCTIPEGITYFGDMAFLDCTKLTAVNIPASVTQAVNYFYGCTNLTSITVDSNNQAYSAENGLLLDKDGETLLYCPEGKDACIIPASVIKIDNYGISRCSKLTDVTLPSGANFSALKSIENLTIARIPAGTTRLSGTFADCVKLETIYLPHGLTEIKGATFVNTNSLKTVYFDGTKAEWAAINKHDADNWELFRTGVKIICKDGEAASSTTPTTPSIPEEIHSSQPKPGGLGKMIEVEIDSGNWITVQTRYEGKVVSITSFQAVDTRGIAAVDVTAPVGSTVQIWETEGMMDLTGGGNNPNVIVLRTSTFNF